jgi:Phosphodiester glycosidase
LSDRAPRPGQGNGLHYQLPDEYGPARAPAPEDADVVVRSTSQTGLLDPDAIQEPVPVTRRERTASQTRQRKRSPWVWRGIAIVLVVLLVPVVWSYVHALQAPGTDSLGIRTVEWVRDHGGNGIVNTVERWWYTNNPPPLGGTPDKIAATGTQGGVDAASVPTWYVPNVAQPSLIQHLAAPTSARVPTPAAVVEQDEGVWQPMGRVVSGFPAVYTTYVRPDAAHTSYYVGLMWLDTKLLRASYVVGTKEPGGGNSPWGSQIPVDLRGGAIAAFNSGFKMDSARGGAWLDGQEIKPLVNGAASFVIKKDGSASVGMWGRDFALGPDVQSVRQNLELLVDNQQLNPALRENDTHAFGDTLGNNVYVWRSGVGVDANGALIYAGGPAMSVMSLARTLQNAGAVKAMELDINTDWVSAYTYVSQDPNNSASATMGVKLLGTMSRAGDRYFSAGERDFFAFLADPKILPVPSGGGTPSATGTTSK